MSDDDTPYKFSFGTSASFSAGDALAISMDTVSSNTYSGDVIATVVLILDWNEQDVSNSGSGGGGGGGAPPGDP